MEHVLHLIIGKWQTPKHSDKKAEDDTHNVKELILSEVRRIFNNEKPDYRRIVGKNPNIGIENNQIILTGVGHYKGKTFHTSLNVGDYFVLRFVNDNINNIIDIQLIVSQNHIKFQSLYINNKRKVLIIPFNEDLISSLIHWSINSFENNDYLDDILLIVEI